MALKAKRSPVGVKSSKFSPASFAGVHKAVQSYFDAPAGEMRFNACDGACLGSVWDLANHLKVMHPDSYSHHVDGDRNDFSNWLKDVHGDVALSERIKDAKSKDHAAKIVVNHIISKLHASAQE